MKNSVLIFLVLGLFVLAFLPVKKSFNISNGVSYEVTITPVKQNNAPALQSFAHGVDGSDWLLFSGRTNSADSLIGGLHSIAKGNYANTSFTPPSFNRNVFVYNVESDQVWSTEFGAFMDMLASNCTACESLTDNSGNLFDLTNPLVLQDNDYLYIAGGYGPSASGNYITSNQIVKLHVPSMIDLVKGNTENINWNNLIRVGHNDTLRSTGGELFKIGDTFYLAGGHNFGSTAHNGQQYVSAVYPFTLTNSGRWGLNVEFGQAISDQPDPTNPSQADSSIFRRRDAPMVPALFRNPVSNQLTKGITFYTGVFKPGSPPLAWNDAIYIHPAYSNDNKLYTYDSAYNQDNHSVYSTAHFEAYESTDQTLHTFLLGGIGTGATHGADTLSGFTNDGVHITLNMETMKSSYKKMETVFSSENLYGAESIIFLNENDLSFYTTSNGETTEIIDLSNTFQNGAVESVMVGYIYGGIEAFQANPQTYGRGKSAASDKLWKVTLHRKSN